MKHVWVLIFVLMLESEGDTREHNIAFSEGKTYLNGTH